MNKIKLISLVVRFGFSVNAFGYGVGWSSYPLKLKERFISAEFTGIFKEGGGAGVQGRYTHKLYRNFVFDAGAGISGGKRESRLFAGADYEIFPDYGNQPHFSVKTTVERAIEFDATTVVIGAAPIVSKGFSFWGKEGYPYFSLPVGLGLNTDEGTYHTRINATFGINGPIPVKGYEKLSANVEAKINLKNTYSGIFLGVSYPLD